jgi:uncharacterized phage protein (TIGR01671 family)
MEMKMREIKFRAWSESRKKMVPLGNVTTVFWPTLRAVEYDGRGKQVSLALMQYTGLKDKNGVEIYEGDILSVKEDGEDCPNHVVEYTNCGYWIDVNGEFDQTSLSCAMEYSYYEYEVIGNIYENPELLEEK